MFVCEPLLLRNAWIADPDGVQPRDVSAVASLRFRVGTRSIADMCTATLRCGTVLAFEDPGFVPASGNSVPCRHHGYCVVDRPAPSDGYGSRRHGRRRARPRGQEELLEWLQGRPVTTLHALQKRRFTLRLVTAAEREGHVAVDLATGTVSVRTADSSRPRCLDPRPEGKRGALVDVRRVEPDQPHTLGSSGDPSINREGVKDQPRRCQPSADQRSSRISRDCTGVLLPRLDSNQ